MSTDRYQRAFALTEPPPERQLSLPEAANPPYQLHDPLVVERGPAFEEAAVVFEALRADAGEVPPQLTRECQRLEEQARRQS